MECVLLGRMAGDAGSWMGKRKLPVGGLVDADTDWKSLSSQICVKHVCDARLKLLW